MARRMLTVSNNMTAFRRNFERFPQELKNELIEVTRETALVDIETEAKLKLTRDRHIDTGRLRASIHTEYQGGPQRVLKGKIRGPLDFIVGTNVIYANHIERIDSYVIWAFDRAKPKYIQRCGEAIQRAGRVL